MRTWIALALMLALLVACASSPPTSPTPLPTPIVRCGEHEPLERLHQFPAQPAELDLDVDPDTLDLDAAREQLRLARAHIVNTNQWAIGTAGVFKRNADRYNGVTDCLDDAHRRGLIL